MRTYRISYAISDEDYQDNGRSFDINANSKAEAVGEALNLIATDKDNFWPTDKIISTKAL